MTRKILVRHVADCPGIDLLRERLAEIGHDHADVEIAFELVATVEEALDLGFCGSPTVLIDGRDYFAIEGATPGLSCRLYRTEQGFATAPSVGQLRQALSSSSRRYARD